MHIFRNRPLALVCCVFAATATLAYFMSALIQLICIITSGLALLVLIFLLFKIKKQVLLLLTMILFSAMLALLSSYLFFHVRYAKWQSYVGEECVVEGVVLEREIGKPYQSALIAELHSMNGKACLVDVRLVFPYATSLQVGDSFRLSGIGSSFETKYMENEEINSVKEGILLCITSEDMHNCEILESDVFSLRAMLSRQNFAASYLLEQRIGGEAGKLASALLLGTRDHLSGSTALQFRRAGVSHLLALSGLHVSILIAALEMLLRFFRCPKRARMAVVFGLAFFYLFFTGASPSIARAVLMLGVLTVGFYWRADYDSLTSISVVLALLLFLSPNAVLDMGLWMSFVAAASIIIFSPVFVGVQEHIRNRWPLPAVLVKPVCGIFSAIIVGVVANLALIFLQAQFFGEMSLASIPATLLLSLPTAALLVLSIFTFILPPLAPVTAFVGRAMLQIAAIFSNQSGVLLPLNDIFSQMLALVLLITLIIIAVVNLKHLLRSMLLPICLSVLIVFCSLGVTYLPERGISFTFLNASGGDLLLFTHKGKSVIIDFSDGTATGGMETLNIASELRCTELDDLVLTHYHNRDTYFIASMARRMHVKRLHLPSPLDDEESAIAKQLTSEAERHGIEVIFGVEELAIKDITIDVLAHAHMPHDRHDALLLSFVIQGERTTYINGSAPQSALAKQMEHYLKESNRVILGETGISSSLTEPIPLVWYEVDEIILADKRSWMLLPNAHILTNVILPEEPITTFLK